MPLTPTEISSIEKLIDGGRLTEVSIERNGKRVQIGGEQTTELKNFANPIAVCAPAVGSLSLVRTEVGQKVTAGDRLALLEILDTETVIAAPISGRIAAILVEDSALVPYGAEIILIDPEDTP